MTASSPKVTKGGFLRRNNLKLPAIGGSSSNGNGNGGGKHAKGNAIVTTATNSKEEGYGSTGTNGSTDDGRVSLNSPKASTSIEVSILLRQTLAAQPRAQRSTEPFLWVISLAK